MFESDAPGELEQLNITDARESATVEAEPEDGQRSSGQATTAKATSITSSGFLASETDELRYGPAKLFDGDPSTAWSEGAIDDGFGDYVRIALDEAVPVTRIRIWRGYDYRDYFERNNRIRSYELWINGAIVRHETVTDSGRYIDVEFSRPVDVSLMDLVIIDTYPGTEWNDTALSEVRFFYNETKIVVENYDQAFAATYRADQLPSMVRVYDANGVLTQIRSLQYEGADFVGETRTPYFEVETEEKFSYDDDGQLREENRFLNEMVPGNSATISYVRDGAGRIVREIEEANLDDTDDPLILEYAYEGDLLVRKEGVRGGVNHTHSFSYSPEGLLTLEVRNQDGQTPREYHYEYEGERLIAHRFTWGSVTFAHTYEYENDRIIRENLGGRLDAGFAEYWYSENGDLHKKVRYLTDQHPHVVSALVTLDYDDNGNVSRETQWRRYRFDFGSEFDYTNGQLVRRYSTGRPVAEYTYDENGNIQTRTDIDHNGRIATYYYDRLGRVTRERMVSPNGELVAVGAYYYQGQGRRAP